MTKTERRWLTSIVLIAATLRVAWVLLVPTEPFSDFRWYHERAMEIASGMGYRVNHGPTAFWAPGYPVFLGGLYAVFGPAVAVGKWANVVLSVGIVYLTFFLGRSLLGTRTALLGAGLVALSPRLISYSSVLATEPLFTLLFLAVASVWATGIGGRWYPLLLGIGTGVLALVKPYTLLFPLLFGCWEWTRRQRLRHVWLTVLFTALMMAITIAPWTYRNWRQMGAFIPISTNGGLVLFINNNPLATGMWMDAFYPGSPLIPYLAPEGGGVFDEVAVDRVGRKLAWQWITEHPGKFIRLGLEKLRVTFLETSDIRWSLEQWSGLTTPLWQSLLYWNNIAYRLFLLVALSWFAASTVRAWHGNDFPVAQVVLGTCLLYFAGIYFVFEGQPRYNVPLLPVWCLAAAAAAGFWRERWNRSRLGAHQKLS